MNYISGNDIVESLANTPQITFEITERCNLQCIYCGYGKMYSNRGTRQGRDLSTDTAIAFLQYIRNLWDAGYNVQGPSNLIISFYGGEPLLHISFIRKVVQYIESNLCGYGKMFTFSMTTNALLLPNYMDFLVEKKFRLLISLDGNENGSSLRVFPNGKPAFSKISKAIDLFKNKYPVYFEKFVEFNSVLSNRTSVKEITEYIHTKYNKTTTVSEINTYGVNPAERDLFKSIYLNKWLSTEEMNAQNVKQTFYDHPQFERIARYVLMHSPYTYFDYNELLFNAQNKRKEIPTGTCFPFAKKVFITVTGNIMPCERISYKYVLGRIEDEKVNIDFDAIAKMYNAYYTKIKPTCLQCFNHRGCLCCMFTNGQLDSDSAQCIYFVTADDKKAMQMEVADFFRKYPEAYSYIMKQYEVIV